MWLLDLYLAHPTRRAWVDFLKRILVGLPGSATVNGQTYYFVVTRSRVDADTRIYREDFKLLSEYTRAKATDTTT